MTYLRPSGRSHEETARRRNNERACRCQRPMSRGTGSGIGEGEDARAARIVDTARLLCPSVRVESSGRFPFTSRWQPFPHQGLWSPPSKHNDSIHDPPCPHPLADHSLSPSRFLFPVRLLLSLYLAKITPSVRSGEPATPKTRDLWFFS